MQLPNAFPGVFQIQQPVQTPQIQVSNKKFKFKKAGNAGTIVAVILDESGSMKSCWDSTISGYNEFLQGQKTADSSAGQAYLTLVKFSAPKITTVYSNLDIREVPDLNKHSYAPLGGTNLMDAIGQTLESINSFLASKSKKDRPGVIVTIMTDGQENSSNQYNKDDIKAMVQEAEKRDWTFNFLGANVDAFAMGSQFGMGMHNSTAYDTANMGATLSAVSASTVRMRHAKMAGTATAEIYSQGLYTDTERKSMK